MIAAEHNGDLRAHLNDARIVAVARHFAIAHLQQFTIKKLLQALAISHSYLPRERCQYCSESRRSTCRRRKDYYNKALLRSNQLTKDFTLSVAGHCPRPPVAAPTRASPTFLSLITSQLFSLHNFAVSLRLPFSKVREFYPQRSTAHLSVATL